MSKAPSVAMLIEAPMALASMSGRTALTTSSREIRSAGTESIDTPRVPNSAGVPIDLAIDGDVVQAGVDAAHDHEPPFALIDFHRDARDPSKRLGGIRVGKAADRVGRHNIHDRWR